MDRLEILKKKLIGREPVLATSVSNINWSGIIQRIAKYGFDFLIFDIEHGTLSIEGVEEMLRICRLVDLPSIIRIPDAIPHFISKSIDMGADGILVPRTERIEQVETAVSFLRFSPKGKKGCGGFSLFRDKEEFADINNNRLLFLQIESNLGIENLPLFIKKFGAEISGIIIGPYDMSIISGHPLNTKCGEMMSNIKTVFKICGDFGKSAGIFVDSAEDLVFWKSAGASIFWTGSEISLLCESYNRLCAAFTGMQKQT
jgi:4-hydroxy-2-oxoheptanedioate aldolase